MDVLIFLCTLLLFIFQIVSAQSKNYPNCTNKFVELKRNISENPKVIDDINEYCKIKPCIAKCCNMANDVLYKNKTKFACTHIETINKQTNRTFEIDYADIKIYTIGIRSIELTEKTIKNNFSLIVNNKFKKTRDNDKNCGPDPGFQTNIYLISEKGFLKKDNPNIYYRFSFERKMEDFCFEYFIRDYENGTVEGPNMVVKYREIFYDADPENFNIITQDLKAAAMLLSSVCLFLILVVYGMLEDMRKTISGMVVMAYVAALLATFVIKSIQLIRQFESQTCQVMSLILYYCLLSTFFWINVWSFDIWWTMSGIVNHRQTNRRGHLVKFGWYSLYAFGVPLLISIVAGVIDFLPLTDRPEIFKPHFENCFFKSEGQVEIKFYVYIPMGILLCFNCLFFLLTTCIIWKTKNVVNQVRAADSKNAKNTVERYFLYLKIFLLMGVSWIFEIVGLPEILDDIASAYNGLIGVMIFFIFVFKRDVFVQLCDRFKIKHRLVERARRKSSAKDGPGLRNSKTSNESISTAVRISDPLDDKGRLPLYPTQPLTSTRKLSDLYETNF